MARASTWTNSDGLVVGFGPNTAEVAGNVNKDFGHAIKSASVVFDYTDTGVNIPVPAGSQIVGVELRVGKAWLGGTRVTVGDNSDPDGFITDAAGATANLTEGASLKGTGVYFVGTGATDREFKTYAGADTIDVTITGAFTAGTATLVISYL